ncbi:ATP-dependent clp protease ATP-binding subunit clpA family protein [Hibiscus syriacus]|uniref:ATP-dependent clp protease ATP-binding subunit clpA family protein n=1 Tax=Hibiscus syriacus TaxID=106335 RepID=A0A6A2X9E1_HIBSY|nr:ATP-dependent clp protease ATP-binding subunit clpA family protein [Hibiscus syriacus]
MYQISQWSKNGFIEQFAKGRYTFVYRPSYKTALPVSSHRVIEICPPTFSPVKSRVSEYSTLSGTSRFLVIWIYAANKFTSRVGPHWDSRQSFLMLKVMKQKASLLLIQTKRSSCYIKGVLIGAMSTLAVMFVVLLAFLWICLLSKKERDAKKYTEVKKQVHQDTKAILEVAARCTNASPDERPTMNQVVQLLEQESSVIALMRCASTQLAPHGIRVNCVSPGPVATPALCNALGIGAEDVESLFSRFVCLKNDVVVFLASEESQFITGHNLVVDGLFQGSA